MPGRILVVCLLLALGACAGANARLAARQPAAEPIAAPTPAEGLWAMLDPGCAKPQGADVRNWPHCASPFWISGDKALVITANAAGRSATHDASYAADFRLTPGTPLIAQVGTQKDGYVFLALTDLARDDQGRLVSAIGAAVACPKSTDSGVAIRPNSNGCDRASLEVVRKAAAATLKDHMALAKVAWIASGAPSVAMLKTAD